MGYLDDKSKILAATTSKLWEAFKGGFEASAIEAFKNSAPEIDKALKDFTAAVTDPKFVSGMTFLVSAFSKLVSYMTQASGWTPIAQAVKALGVILPAPNPQQGGQTVGGKIGTHDFGLLPAPEKAAQDKINLAARDADAEALIRARAAEADKEFNRTLKQVDTEADYELQVLDKLHQLKLIKEQDWLDQVDAINKKRSDDAVQAQIKVVTQLQSAAAEVYRHNTGDKYKLAVTQVNDAQQKLSDMLLKSGHASDLRHIASVGRAMHGAEGEGVTQAGIDADLGKVWDKQMLAMQGARVKLDQAVSPAEVAIGYAAAQKAEAAYLTEFEKITKAREEQAAKTKEGDTVEQRKLAMLDMELAKLPQLRAELTKQIIAEDLLNRERERSLAYGAQRAFAAYVEAAGDAAAQSGALVTKSIKGMEDALVNFAMTGKTDFKSLANSIISDMIRMQVQANVTKPLASIGGGLLASLFGPTQGIGISGNTTTFDPVAASAVLGSANGNVFNSASLSALSGGIYNSPTFFKFANGGVLGEAGPEAVMPLTRGSNGKLGVQASGAPSVTLNIVNQSGTPVNAKQTGPAQLDGDTWVIGVVLSAVENNPHVRNALAGALR